MVEKGEGSACYIVCTQPRRIAAISVAERVAYEFGEKVKIIQVIIALSTSH
jgi:HrpA-like RNA helicase